MQPKSPGNFCWKSNGTVIFWKIRSEIIDYLQTYPLFPFGTERRKFTHHLINFSVSSLSSAVNNYGKSNCKLQPLSQKELAIYNSIGWCADFGKKKKRYSYSTVIVTGLFQQMVNTPGSGQLGPFDSCNSHSYTVIICIRKSQAGAKL